MASVTEVLIGFAVFLMCFDAALGQDADGYMFETNVPRKAYVIGISDYQHEEPIPSAAKDASDVKDKLELLRFKVTVAPADAKSDAESLRKNFIQFLRTVDRGDIVVFYFSGHGFWYRGQSYLVPSTIDNSNPPKQPGTTIPVSPGDLNLSVSQIITLLENVSAGQATIIVDACRNAPTFPMTKTDEVQKKIDLLLQASVLQFFASQEGFHSEGNTGPDQNSVYTRYLLQFLDQKGQPIIEAQNSSSIKVQLATNGNQKPSIAGQYVGRIYLAPTPENLDEEKRLWHNVLVAGNEEDAKYYMMLLPGSRYLAAARKWLADRQDKPKKLITTKINPFAVEEAGTFAEMINTRAFPAAGAKTGLPLSQIISGLTGSLEFGSAQRTITSTEPRIAVQPRPTVVVRRETTGFDKAGASAKKLLALNAGDSLAVNDVTRIGDSNWIEGITQDGKTVFVPNAVVPDLRGLPNAKRTVADVTFRGNDILAPADLTGLRKSIGEIGADKVSGVSIRLQPPTAVDKRYATASSQLRLTQIRAALIELGVRTDVIGGIVEQAKGELPENTARVTIAAF